jgi:transcriptional regulator with XRE-family HTH domain
VREWRDITQADVADAVGYSRTAVSEWEADVKVPREEAVAKLSDFLGVTPAFLRYGIGGRPDAPTREPPRREDVDAARERQAAKRRGEPKKNAAGDRSRPTRPPKPR